MAGEAGSATGGTGAAVGAAAQGAVQTAQIGDMISGFTPSADKAAGTKTGAEDATKGQTTTGTEGAAGAAGETGETSAEGEGEGQTTPTEGEEGSEIETLRQQVGELTAKIAEMSGKATLTTTPEAKPSAAQEPFTGEFFDSKEEFDQTFENQAAMNKVLSKVAVTTAQRILANLPKVVDNIVKQQVEVQSKIKDFFVDNKDLTKHKQFVGFVANDLGGKNPGWTVDKLFTELGGEVRKRIGIKTQAGGAAPGTQVTGKKGAFPPSGKGARPPAQKSEQLTSLEKEINDLIN